MKRQARVPTVIGERLLFFTLEAAQHCAEPRAAAEKTCGFVSGQPESIFFRDIDAADFCELDQFAFDHFLSQVDQNVENPEIAFFQGHLKGLHVQPVAGEDAAMIAPF